MGDVIVVRHGSTAWNRGGVGKDKIRGHADIPLNAAGRDESRRLAELLAKHPIKMIHGSDLERSAETARLIAEHHDGSPVQLHRKFRSWDLGDLHGKVTIPGVIKQIREYVKHPDTVPPGGESFNTYQHRFLGAVAEVLKGHKQVGDVVLVTHARGVQLVQLWLDHDQDGDAMYAHHSADLAKEPDTVAPGGFIRLAHRSGKWRVEEEYKPAHGRITVS